MAWIEFFSTLNSGYSYPLIPVYFFLFCHEKTVAIPSALSANRVSLPVASLPG